MSDEKQNRPALRLVKAVALNAVPGYPMIKAFGSAKATVMSGLLTIDELKEKVEGKKRMRRVRTWNQAIAARPVDALPLSKIASDCLARKRVALIFIVLCTAYMTGGLIGGNFMPVYGGCLGSMLPAMYVLREEHRLWQMEVGPTQPDEPLGSIGTFLRTRGVLLRLLNPYLFLSR
jgi:hypothetical protein